MKSFPFEIILDWYKRNGRHDLPWRKLQTPYHVWISEIFLQQTQVSRVKDYFNTVVDNFPSVQDFSKLSYDEFFPFYKWLGYYSRARNMLKTSAIIVQNYSWVFPNNYDDLVNLPWIGPYTAQAILSFGHDQNILAFDTNIEKIFSRYYFGNKFQKLSKIEKWEIQALFEKTWISWREMNAAMMDFSSIIDINQINLIDFKSYPLTSSEFHKTKWMLEIKKTPLPSGTPLKKGRINKSEAQIIVILHENHETYFSAHPDNFEAFIFEPNSWDHRHHIQEIFSKKYNLELSVRPVYKKISSAAWSYFFYHAQIQSGQHSFWEFPKPAKLDWENSFMA